MKTIAPTVVTLFNKGKGPSEPKTVWLEPPPKDAPMSAPLPCCKRTMPIRKIQTLTCKIVNNVIIICYLMVYVIFTSTAKKQQKRKQAAHDFYEKLISRSKESIFNAAPPTSAPSMSFCAIRLLILSGLTLPPYSILN